MDTMDGQKRSDGNWSHCQVHDMCGGTCGHHHWKHVLIKILVALFIFWCGVQFGELKSLLRGGNMHYGVYSTYGAPTMMSGWSQ